MPHEATTGCKEPVQEPGPWMMFCAGVTVLWAAAFIVFALWSLWTTRPREETQS